MFEKKNAYIPIAEARGLRSITIMMVADKYSIFSVLEHRQMFDKEALVLSNKIKQEIAKVVEASSVEDKEEGKAIFARKVAYKLTEAVYRGK